MLGPVKRTVTQISAGTQHNVVPDECRYVVDVRPTECYTNEEILAIIRANVQAEITPRSTHLQSSGLALEHPIVRKAVAMGKTTYGSPTLSDQALMRFPTLKMGPGDSARSHTPDEYILLSEIRAGIADYIELLTGFSI
jgi:acetylornithine deacetylase